MNVEHLYDKLVRYASSDFYPYHMPGHKRNMADKPMKDYYKIDITEIEGFDNLHQPEGILLDLKKRVSELYNTDESFLLINGSTGGILSAIAAVFRRGETILMARNCHKSVYHGVYLNGLHATYVYPGFVEEYGICGSISKVDIKRRLDENPEIKGIFLTSPTYDGVVSDIREIVRLAHERNIPVIVDEAHGAHFIFDKRFPESAVQCGADLVIHSIHKTLPSLTQTAVLHVQGELIDKNRLRRFLKMYQTSSPSYILMAGIEQCISIMENEAEALCNHFFEQNELFEQRIKKLQLLKVLSGKRKEDIKIYDFDPGKKLLVVRGCQLSGRALYKQLLEDYHLQMEMAGQDYVTAIMTIMDTKEGFDSLAAAAIQIDQSLQRTEVQSFGEIQKNPIVVYDMAQAVEMETKDILLEACENHISAEFVHVYPPGIPLIVPGERFTKGIIEQLSYYRRQGFTIEGMKEKNQKVCVIGKEIYYA